MYCWHGMKVLVSFSWYKNCDSCLLEVLYYYIQQLALISVPNSMTLSAQFLIVLQFYTPISHHTQLLYPSLWLWIYKADQWCFIFFSLSDTECWYLNYNKSCIYDKQYSLFFSFTLHAKLKVQGLGWYMTIFHNFSYVSARQGYRCQQLLCQYDLRSSPRW